MRVLVSDKIAKRALALFSQAKIDFDYFPEISPFELTNTIAGYEALIVRSRTKVTAEILQRGTKLKVVGRVGSGVDNIDLPEARARKILVVNAPGANSQAVAEHTLALLLSLLRRLSRAFSSMKEGLWLKKELMGEELAGKIVGIIGYGEIGQKVARLVSAFGAQVLYFSRRQKNALLEEIFSRADIITLHLPLSPETKGLVNEKLLSLMRPTAFLLNTSRGEVIEEEALYQALAGKKIAGAALDVFWQEPLEAVSRWRSLENVILTPHIAGSTKEALEKASTTVISDILRVLQGQPPVNLVL